jgi:hypothetical protein
MPPFRKRPGESPQRTGRRFEAFWARVFGVEPTRGSGNQWHARLDVGDGAILWSCKHTDADSFRLSRELMREAEAAINGPGGVGGKTLPGIAVSLDGEVYCVLRAEDFLRLLKTEGAAYIPPSRGEQKRSRSKIPALLRDDPQ